MGKNKFSIDGNGGSAKKIIDKNLEGQQIDKSCRKPTEDSEMKGAYNKLECNEERLSLFSEDLVEPSLIQLTPQFNF